MNQNKRIYNAVKIYDVSTGLYSEDEYDQQNDYFQNENMFVTQDLNQMKQHLHKIANLSLNNIEGEWHDKDSI